MIGMPMTSKKRQEYAGVPQSGQSSEAYPMTSETKPSVRYQVTSGVRRNLLPIGVFVTLMMAWQFSPTIFNIPEYVLPKMSDVLRIFVQPEALSQLADNGKVTLMEAAIGLAIGASGGFFGGILFAVFPVIDKAFYPYIVAIQSVPKIAIAPLFVIWLGFGMSSKVLVVVILTLFPVLVNTIAGMRATDEDSMEMFRSIGAGRLQQMWKLRIPTAMPSVLTGLEIAVVMAMLGAIVGEFVGAQKGLGVMILQAQFNLNIPGVFAVLIVLAGIGTGLNLLVRILRRRILFWMPYERRDVPDSTT